MLTAVIPYQAVATDRALDPEIDVAVGSASAAVNRSIE
jgi:hypothetical protein